jgi:phthalate 4,5-dioxygenase
VARDLLTRAARGSATGRKFRSHWIPALLADELPESDAPPVHVD